MSDPLTHFLTYLDYGNPSKSCPREKNKHNKTNTFLATLKVVQFKIEIVSNFINYPKVIE